MSGVSRSCLPDQHDGRAVALQLLASAVQLDRVGAAVDSAVVAQPDQCHRSVLPQIAEADLIAVVVGQHDLREGIRFSGGARPSGRRRLAEHAANPTSGALMDTAVA